MKFRYPQEWDHQEKTPFWVTFLIMAAFFGLAYLLLKLS